MMMIMIMKILRKTPNRRMPDPGVQYMSDWCDYVYRMCKTITLKNVSRPNDNDNDSDNDDTLENAQPADTGHRRGICLIGVIMYTECAKRLL